HLGGKFGVVARRLVGRLEVEDQRHQGFGDEPAAIKTEAAGFVRPLAQGIGQWGGVGCTHGTAFPVALWAARARVMNRLMRPASFSPLVRSTPEETSRPHGLTRSIAAETLSGSRPPESKNGIAGSSASTSAQSKGVLSPPGRVAALGGLAASMRRSAGR